MAADASLMSFSDSGSGSPVIPPPAESGTDGSGSSSTGIEALQEKSSPCSEKSSSYRVKKLFL